MGGVLTGGCHCGAVRYEAKPQPGHRALCHCTDCRKVSGAPALAWFTAATDDFAFTAGTPIRYASSERAVRQFCGACGTQLTFAEHAYGGERVDVATASLDDPEAQAPTLHIYTKSRLGWMRGLDALPERGGDIA